MYGAWIGAIAGSKYKFNNIKTKNFPLFSQGCDYTDGAIMTAAVAKAIVLSRHEQEETAQRGRGFQEFLVEVMQDFGRRYPHPMGAYGGKFANWLRQKDPKPYGSFGNGSAMRVSPCGLAATSIEEALVLARVCASVTHDHPEGIKGAEAVAAAIFMAKCGESKEAIRQYISEHFYRLDFTLDAIRDSYRLDKTCQGTVPQAIAYLPEEFLDIEKEFLDVSGKRAGVCNRVGWCTPILNRKENEKYWKNGGKADTQPDAPPLSNHAGSESRCDSVLPQIYCADGSPVSG